MNDQIEKLLCKPHGNRYRNDLIQAADSHHVIGQCGVVAIADIEQGIVLGIYEGQVYCSTQCSNNSYAVTLHHLDHVNNQNHQHKDELSSSSSSLPLPYKIFIDANPNQLNVVRNDVNRTRQCLSYIFTDGRHQK